MLQPVTTADASPYCIVYCRNDTGQILLNRLYEHLDQAEILLESQFGFRKDRRTIDMIFSSGHFQEKYQKQTMDFYMTFVDITKAFDTVSRDGLRKIMETFGCPARFITMVRQFRGDLLAQLQKDRQYS